MAIKCATCRHWLRAEEGYPFGTGLEIHRCKRIPHGADVMMWDDDCNNVLKPEYAGTLAFANDASGYAASLTTAADFFCAYWEPEE